jgi:hypothetical protein
LASEGALVCRATAEADALAPAALGIATLAAPTDFAVRAMALADPDEDGTARAEASGPGAGSDSGKSTATMANGEGRT